MWTLRFSGGTPVMSLPSSQMLPPLGASNPATMRRRVVLPQPDGPKQAEEFARLDAETDVVYRDEVAETPSDVTNLQKRHRRARDKARILTRMPGQLSVPHVMVRWTARRSPRVAVRRGKPDVNRMGG